MQFVNESRVCCLLAAWHDTIAHWLRTLILEIKFSENFRFDEKHSSLLKQIGVVSEKSNLDHHTKEIHIYNLHKQLDKVPTWFLSH